MESFDQAVRDLMGKYNVPGGAVAVVHDGKLFYARGFGYADIENKVAVQPDALFRIASVSKPITSEGYRFCNSKIRHDSDISREKEILRLDVAMDHALTVCVLKSARQVAKNRNGCSQGNWSLLHPRP